MHTNAVPYPKAFVLNHLLELFSVALTGAVMTRLAGEEGVGRSGCMWVYEGVQMIVKNGPTR